jgi:nicotinate-nucleotide pyrophosphorylase (carboxylating)
VTAPQRTLAALPRIAYEDLVRAALREDLGAAGDLTSDAVVPATARAVAARVARRAGTLAGIEPALLAFRLMDDDVVVERERNDGDQVAAGETIATVAGSARALLAAERTALNILSHLSGIATLTAAYVAAAAPHAAAIVCTRKTTPGLRVLEKYAVRAGGGANHRFGLYDAILIKDNHVAIAGGVAEAIRAARAGAGHLVKLEVEVDDLAQLRAALDAGADVILLDNMSVETLAEAVRITAGRARLEASGSVSLDNVNAIAATGVDLISVGRLTHSAPALDIGMDFRPGPEGRPA